MTSPEPEPRDPAALVALPTRMPPQLLKYWTVGRGATRVKWNTPGDWTRCNRILRKYIPNARKRKGLCANLHKLVTSRWPNEGNNIRGSVATPQQYYTTRLAALKYDNATPAVTGNYWIDRLNASRINDSQGGTQ